MFWWSFISTLLVKPYLLEWTWASPTLAWLHCAHACVCLLACLRPYTINFKWAVTEILVCRKFWSVTDSACHCNSLGLLQVRWELPRLPFVELLVVLCSIQERRRKTSIFNPDQFLQRQTIFSSENFGPVDRNFQDQNSHDRVRTNFNIMKIKLGGWSLKARD